LIFFLLIYLFAHLLPHTITNSYFSFLFLSSEEPSIPFKEKLKDLEVREKESATFQCEVPVPSTETAWFKEETKLRQSKKYNIEEEGTYRRLTVQNITTDDDAVYICEMKEGSRTIAELSVQGKKVSCYFGLPSLTYEM